MKLAVIEECPHCSKRLAGALDHWSKMFMDGTVDDDFADEISEILSNRSESLKSYINQLAKENNIVSN